tara:strand:- start:10376 stop:11596 length:1221 start_codon:yes stop_codon:yes gene_type:complete
MPIAAHIPKDCIYDFDIHADSIKGGDVQRAHEALHDKAPDIFYTPRNGGHWMATRFQHVTEIMTNPDIFASAGSIPKPKIPFMDIRLPPQDMDAPDHMRHRLLLMKFLAPKEIRKLEPQIRSLMAAHVSEVRDRGHCEFMRDISVPFPVKTFMSMMHMDLVRYVEFVRWANGILGATNNLQRVPHFVRMTNYLKSLIRERKRNPSDDPISMLLAAEINGEKLSDKRVLQMCNLLFLAGLDTVTNAMTFIVRHLAENPEDQNLLREHPERIPEAVEEFMRRYAFVNTPRRVTADTDFHGVQLKQGDIIWSSFAAASNDDENVSNPLQVDLDRRKSPHLAFNTGPHNCAGANLARLELKIFLEEWLSSIPAFRVRDGFVPAVRGGPVMAMESLELVWDADINAAIISL